MNKHYYVYLLTNHPYGTLYVGVTNDLVRRLHEHREGLVAGFSKTHQLTQLVWYEQHEDVHAAIAAEKRIKRWRRDWKVNVIQQGNSEWRDLYSEIC